ncbi:putative tricarboxylic transport membrane protein [Rhodococcoides kroppenstedtii]|nr:putative tricarboxylic transport membrane protein [Rhodococcus kroppenstedtii]
MIEALTTLHGTDAWKEALVTNGWTDAFETGDAFETFLQEQDARVESTLTELGLV